MHSNPAQVEKVITAGLVESGASPALYFDLTNTGPAYANYTYRVSYNATAGGPTNHTSTVTVSPGATYHYSISLRRPASGVLAVNLQIFPGAGAATTAALYNQTWYIRAQP